MGRHQTMESIAAEEEKGGGVLLRRTSSVVAVAVVIALALVVVSLAVAPKPADAATQVVTKAFDKPASILIPAGADVADCASGPTQGVAAPYPSDRTIQAFPEGSTILDVDLVLRNFTHGFPDGVDVLLSKGPHNRTVMSDVGASDDVNGITLKLDDEASKGLPYQRTLRGGTFKPRNSEGIDEFQGMADASVNTKSSLSGFDGRNPNGTWQLRVVDDAADDCGEFGGGWTLIIEARVPTT